MLKKEERWVERKNVVLPEIEKMGFAGSVLHRNIWENEEQPDMESPIAVSAEVYLLRNQTNERINITGDRFIVGKGKTANYKIEGNQAISREHAVFIRQKDGVYIEDMQSLNHTYLNGELAMGRRKLSDADVIKIADEEFVFCIVEG